MSLTVPLPTQATLLLLRAEGAAVLLAGIAVFAHSGAAWWIFAALFLAPDLAMLGYLRGPRVGAALYNAAHWYLPPLLLGIAAALAGRTAALALAAIWVAHIGFDRMLGYGLKLPTGFRHTHLGTLGA